MFGDYFYCKHICGYLASPNYPHDYHTGMHVTWDIEVVKGTYIELLFTEIEVESQTPDCEQDHVLVFDISTFGGLTLLGRHCNVNLPKRAHFSSWNKMQVNLITDSKYNAKGFFAKYTSKSFEISEELEQYIYLDGMFDIACSH